MRGASTIRYSFDVDLDVAVHATPRPPTRPADVEGRHRPTDVLRGRLVDSRRLVRRVQVPLDKRDKRPGYQQAVLERLVTVDFFDYNDS